jgi:superfamily II DNA helicase RecQ
VLCAAWDRQRPPDEAAIVLVTPESAVTSDFQTFINRLAMMRRLDRVVVNECHIIINRQKDFQPQMA